MKRSGAIAAALAAAALIGGCTGTFTAGPAYPTGGVAANTRWQDPGFFAARVDERMNNIEQRVRADIGTGQIPAEAINDFHERRAQVTQAVQTASADGMIDPQERRYVRSLVQQSAQVTAARGGGTYNQPYGGGPGWGSGGMNYYDSSWTWGD